MTKQDLYDFGWGRKRKRFTHSNFPGRNFTRDEAIAIESAKLLNQAAEVLARHTDLRQFGGQAVNTTPAIAKPSPGQRPNLRKRKGHKPRGKGQPIEFRSIRGRTGARLAEIVNRPH